LTLHGQLEDLPLCGQDATDGGVFEKRDDGGVSNGDDDAGGVFDYADDVRIIPDRDSLMAGDEKNAER
jgi:hypothetical protein